MKRNTGKTSLNQVPAGMKLVKDWPGDLNFDYGGGKYETASEWLWEEKKVINLVYDKYNRSEKENALALRMLHECKTFTCFNTLNVMEDFKERLDVYHLVKRMVGLPAVFFTVYEGDKSGVGILTTKGWQNNLPTSFYLGELQETFKYGYDVMTQSKLIVVQKLDTSHRLITHQVKKLYGGF